MIFIDLKVQEFSNNAWSLLKKRCPVIEAKFSKEGINLNWELLMKLIQNPQKNFSQDFKNTYFENISKVY